VRAVVTLARDAQIPKALKALDQFPNGPSARLSAAEASHDRLPQVDANGLDFNEFFQGLLAKLA
jgi:hypothetical protein